MKQGTKQTNAKHILETEWEGEYGWRKGDGGKEGGRKLVAVMLGVGLGAVQARSGSMNSRHATV